MAIQASRADYGTSLLKTVTAMKPGYGAMPMTQRPLLLHAMLTSCGREISTSPAYDWHGLKRGAAEFVLLQYTLAGRGRLTYAGEDYLVEPGQAIALWFPFDNRYRVAPGEHWHHTYLCLSGREALRAWKTAIARRGPLLTLAPESPLLHILLETVLAAERDELHDPFTASAQAYTVAMRLLAETCSDHGQATRHAGIAQAKLFAKQHFTRAIGVDDLAAAAGLSRFHFTRLFTRQEGISPAAHVTDLRIRHAANRLRESRDTISVIASACGYPDPAYFCRVFRRALGVSPGEFRSSGMY